MTCREVETLLLAEAEGQLTTGPRSGLEQHVAACPGCRQLRATLGQVGELMRREAAAVTVPDANQEWQRLQGRLAAGAGRPARKRPLAPVIWFGASLAAAAAVALAFYSGRPSAIPAAATVAAIAAPPTAQADFVEAGDANASTMVYVDKDSGWLVVWAADSDANGKG